MSHSASSNLDMSLLSIIYYAPCIPASSASAYGIYAYNKLS